MNTLSVVVVNWNRYDATRDCLSALAAWKRLEPRVVVVDNASVPADADRLSRDFPAVDWLRSEANLGYGGGNNLALRRIGTEYALLLNNDAWIAEDDVARLIAVMERHERLFAVGPVIADTGGEGDGDGDGHHGEVRIAGGRDIARHIGTRWTVDNLPAGTRIEEGLHGVDYVPGAAALLRVEPVRQLGYLAEGYFFGGELADICRMARRAGLQVAVQLEATASHDSEVAARLRQGLYPYYTLRNRFLYLRRHERRASVLLLPLWVAYGVAVAARALLRQRPRLAIILALAVLDGLRGRFGNQNGRVLRVAEGAAS